MKIAVNLLIFIFVLVLVATALLYTQQRRLLFPAPSDYPRAALPGFRLVHTRTDDGLRLAAFYRPAADRQSVVSGKSVSVRVALGGRRIIKKKITKYTVQHYLMHTLYEL